MLDPEVSGCTHEKTLCPCGLWALVARHGELGSSTGRATTGVSDCREEHVTVACEGTVGFGTERERGQRFDHVSHRIRAADDAR